jgi:hypothetical protein
MESYKLPVLTKFSWYLKFEESCALFSSDMISLEFEMSVDMRFEDMDKYILIVQSAVL